MKSRAWKAAGLLVIYALLTAFWWFLWAPAGKFLLALGVIGLIFSGIAYFDGKIDEWQFANDRLFRKSKSKTKMQDYKDRTDKLAREKGWLK